MKQSNLSPYLYLVSLGGNIQSAHIEQHDIRWVVGFKIEDTFNQLRKQWVGRQKGLHIDSYLIINYIDGYRISLSHSKLRQYTSNESNSYNETNNLWFVNLGGYDPDNLYEIHKCFLVISSSSKQAISIAKRRWLNKFQSKHKDNIYNIAESHELEECYSLDVINGWYINLVKDPLLRSQDLKPDWYGYLRIDSYFQEELLI